MQHDCPDEQTTYDGNVAELEEENRKRKPSKKAIKKLMNTPFSCKCVGCSAILWAYLT